MKVSLSCERTIIQETFHQEAVSHIYETDNEQCSYDIYIYIYTHTLHKKEMENASDQFCNST